MTSRPTEHGARTFWESSRSDGSHDLRTVEITAR